MTSFSKKRTSIIVEQIYTDSVISLIEKSGASGYTIHKELYGKGRHGIKENYGSLSAFGNVEIITITSEEVATKILEGLQQMLDNDINLIVHLVDTLVIRNNHFN